MPFLKIEINSELGASYNNSISHYINSSDWKINVFFHVSNSEYIKENWLKIGSSISASYQSQLSSKNDEFERWNFYIIYISRDEVEKGLKNKIENDKFSSRKIVEDKFSNELTEEIANNLIVRHITNTDLTSVIAKTKENIVTDYVPLDKNLWQAIPDSDLITGDVAQQKSIVEILKQL